MVGWQGAALLAAAMVLSGCAALAGGFDTVESPGWKPGYRFVYGSEVDMSMASAMYENGTRKESEEETKTTSLEERRAVEVVATHEQDGRSYYLAIETFTQNGYNNPRLIAFRASDLAQLSVSLTSSGAQVREMEREGPMRFPLIAGDSYTYTNDEARTEVEVNGMETVDGPDGPVKAIEVVHTPNVDDLRKDLEEGFTDKDSTEADVDGEWELERTAYFAPSLHAVVVQRTDIVIDAEITYREDGTDHRVTLKGEFHGTERLMEASLQTRPALSLDEIRDVLSGLAPITPGPLPNPSPGSASLQLGLPDGHVQIGTTGTIPVEVRGIGIDGAVSVKLLQGYDVVASRSARVGSTVELPVRGAGLYSIVAVTGSDDPYATARADVAVDAAFEVPVDCPQVGLPDTPCTALPVEVFAGVAKVRFTAIHHPLAAEPAVGTVSLWNPSAERSDQTMAGHSATVEADGRAGMWSARFDPLGPTGAITYRMELKAKEPAPSGQGLLAPLQALGWV